MAIDFSYRLLELGVAGEFEYFNGTAEWTPAAVVPKFHPFKIYEQVLNALHFGGRPKAAGDAFISRTGLGKSGFLAVHVRRGDMMNWRNRQHAWPEKEAIAEQAVALMNSLGLKKAFLATDTTPEEKAWFLSAIPGLVTFEPLSGEQLMEAEIAIVDQVIAGQAKSFLGNFWSTFSWAIIEERYKRGAHDGSNSFQLAPLSEQQLKLVGTVRQLR